MQTMGALSNEAAAAQRYEQAQVGEQLDHNGLAQLMHRVQTLEVAQNSGHAAQHPDANLQSQLQAQSASVKDESTKIQDIVRRLEILENAKKSSASTTATSAKQELGVAAIMKRLDELEKWKRSHLHHESLMNKTRTHHHESLSIPAPLNNKTEPMVKDMMTMLHAMQAQLDTVTKDNAALHAEVNVLKSKSITAGAPTPKSKTMKSEDKDEDKDDDDDKDDKDESLLQSNKRGFRNSDKSAEEKIQTEFHLKSRRHKA